MKINWGVGIAVLYIAFVVMIGTLVAATFNNKPSLVAEDYYLRETQFQGQLNAATAAAALGVRPRMQLLGDSLVIALPTGSGAGDAVGTIGFYAPSNPGADAQTGFHTADGTIHIAVPQVRTKYILHLDWYVGGTRYYTEIPWTWTR